VADLVVSLTAPDVSKVRRAMKGLIAKRAGVMSEERTAIDRRGRHVRIVLPDRQMGRSLPLPMPFNELSLAPGERVK
jgi:hypothetical protein